MNSIKSLNQSSLTPLIFNLLALSLTPLIFLKMRKHKKYLYFIVVGIVSIPILYYFSSVLMVAYNADSGLNYCNKLKAIAADSSTQSKLYSWVKNNVLNTKVDPSEIEYSSTMPGIFTYKTNFDWDVLQFDQGVSTVSIVGSDERQFNNGMLENITSISFAERSRYSILVRVDSSKNDWGLGANIQYLHPVSDNIGVFCFRSE